MHVVPRFQSGIVGMPRLLVALMLVVVPMEGEAPVGPVFAARRHESPSPETPRFVRGGHSKTFLGGSGGLRVLKDSMGWRARSRPGLWRSTMCSLMVFALEDVAEPHQQQR